MGRITLYGVPSSVAGSIRSILSGTLGDVLWTLLILSLLGVLAYLLVATGGVFGAFVGATLLATLWEDDVRAAVANILNRNWAEVEAPW
jgi:uncharacterized membrane protein YfcA